MSLLDRYERRALWMAAFQLLVFGGVLIYGLAKPSLGARLLAPGLVMAAVCAALIWLTLHRPWDASFVDTGPRRPFVGRYVPDPALITAMTLWVANCQRGVLEQAKETIVEQVSLGRGLGRSVFDTVDEAWAADTYGMLLVSDSNAFMLIAMPLAALGLLWFFLPR